MASKSVYGLFFETEDRGLVLFYVGCTVDVVRREQDHKRNAFDAKSIEYDTYKYKFIRDLASVGIDFRLEVLTPQEEINDRSDEYSWVLKFAEYNKANGITFYDGLPLTNMKGGDFLEEMLADKSVRTPQQIRTWRKNRAEQIREIRYNRDRFGVQTRNEQMRRDVMSAVRLAAEESKTQRVLRDLQKQQRAARAEANLKQIREQQHAEWLATGRLIGEGNEIKRT